MGTLIPYDNEPPNDDGVVFIIVFIFLILILLMLRGMV